MFATSRLADRGHARAVGVGAAALLGLAPLAFLGPYGAWAVLGAGVLFFLGHSSLSALLPSLVSGAAAEGTRGASQGLQSTLQYFGSAVGSAAVAAAHPDARLMGAAFVASGVVMALALARSASTRRVSLPAEATKPL